MARRPSFQFYPGDWASNTNLKRCPFEEKGAWIDLLCLLHDSDEYGILRWSLAELALAIGCEISILESLVRKTILKGSDVEKVSFSTSITQKNDPPITVTLIDAQMGPLWYSSRLVRDEYVRKQRAIHGYKSAQNPNVPKKRKEMDTLSTSPLSASAPSSSSASSSASFSSSSTYNNESPAQPRIPTHLPADFSPNEENITLMQQLKHDSKIIFEKFKAYVLSHGWKRVDWNEAFKKWILDEKNPNNPVKNEIHSTVQECVSKPAQTDEERNEAMKAYAKHRPSIKHKNKFEVVNMDHD